MRPERHLLELSLAASALVHLGSARLLPAASEVAPPSVSAPVRFVPAPRAAPPEPAPEPKPAPPPPPKAPPAPPKHAPAPAAPSPALEPATKPPSLAGTTLTAPGESGAFAAPTGDGSSHEAPVVVAPPAPPAPPEPRGAAPTARSVPAPRRAPAPATVPIQDLSRRPAPPSLAGVLAQNYPASLRSRGVGGQAVVRARVDADGRVRVGAVSSESEPGFGSACQRTLVGSRWTPPLDRAGRPVATWVRYTCRFRVGL
jgi:outer membrane biosynthesis protein TonB